MAPQLVQNRLSIGIVPGVEPVAGELVEPKGDVVPTDPPITGETNLDGEGVEKVGVGV